MKRFLLPRESHFNLLPKYFIIEWKNNSDNSLSTARTFLGEGTSFEQVLGKRGWKWDYRRIKSSASIFYKVQSSILYFCFCSSVFPSTSVSGGGSISGEEIEISPSFPNPFSSHQDLELFVLGRQSQPRAGFSRRSAEEMLINELWCHFSTQQTPSSSRKKLRD